MKCKSMKVKFLIFRVVGLGLATLMWMSIYLETHETLYLVITISVGIVLLDRIWDLYNALKQNTLHKTALNSVF
jgi:hypothetical protein